MSQRPQRSIPVWLRVLPIAGGTLLLAFGGFVLILTLIFPSVDDLCGNDEVTEVISPDGKLKAVTFRRNCGATTAYSTHVSILPASRKLPNEAGNVFAQAREPIMVVRWIADRHLNISGGGAGTAFLHRAELNDVRITCE